MFILSVTDYIIIILIFLVFYRHFFGVLLLSSFSRSFIVLSATALFIFLSFIFVLALCKISKILLKILVKAGFKVNFLKFTVVSFSILLLYLTDTYEYLYISSSDWYVWSKRDEWIIMILKRHRKILWWFSSLSNFRHTNLKMDKAAKK